jgi:hypothetical protein
MKENPLYGLKLHVAENKHSRYPCLSQLMITLVLNNSLTHVDISKHQELIDGNTCIVWLYRAQQFYLFYHSYPYFLVGICISAGHFLYFGLL